jgi:hypothetical protein
MRTAPGGLSAVLVGLAAVGASAQGPPAEAPDTVDIRRLESTLAEALHARDRARLDWLLAADYVLRGAPDVDRAAWLQNALTHCLRRSRVGRQLANREHDGAERRAHQRAVAALPMRSSTAERRLSVSGDRTCERRSHSPSRLRRVQRPAGRKRDGSRAAATPSFRRRVLR